MMAVAMPMTAALAQDDTAAGESVPDPWPEDTGQSEIGQPAKDERFGQGFYVRLGGATGIETGLADETAKGLEFVFGPPVSVDVSPAIGLDLRLGARGGHFGSEVQIEWLPNFTVDAVAGGGPFPEFDWKYLTASGNFHLILLTGRVQPYLLIGAGGTWVSTNPETETGSAFMVRGGGGLDVFLNEHVAVAADVSYVYPTGDLGGGDYVAIDWGLKYVF